MSELSTRRGGAILRVALLLAFCLGSFAIAGGLVDKAQKLLEYFHLGSYLNGNAYSGLTYATATQAMARLTLVCVGLGLLCLAWAMSLARRVWPTRSAFLRPLLRRPELFVLPLIVAVYFGAVHARTFAFDSGPLVGLDDDAMISLRYAYNFAHHQGLVYNPGERVEGYTNFLWTVLASVPFFCGATQAAVSKAFLFIDFALVSATIVLMAATLRRLRCATWAITVAVLGYAFDCNTLYFASSGLETVCLAFFVSACAYAVVARMPGMAFVSLALLALTRSDAALSAFLLCGLAVSQFRREQISVRAAPMVPAVVLAHFLWRRWYYGYWFPNTYYLKMMRLHDRLIVGIGSYGFRIVAFYTVLILLAIAAVFAVRRARLLAAGWISLVLVQGAYAIWVGGDAFLYLRFLTPTLPLLYMSAARGAAALVGAARARRGVFAIAFAGFMLATVPVQTAEGRLGHYWSARGWVKVVGTAAQWMTANLPAGTLATIYPAGGVPYLAPSLRFIDVLGKADLHVAHLDRYVSYAIGHNRFDFDYVFDVRKPDVAYVDRNCNEYQEPLFMTPEQRAALRASVPPTMSPAWEYNSTHPTFLALYGHNRVRFVGEIPPVLGCLFLREGTTLPQFWAKHGPPPRATELRYVTDQKNDDRIVATGNWAAVPGIPGIAPKIVSGGESKHKGSFDAWLALDHDLVMDVCLGYPSERIDFDPAEHDFHANGVVLTRVPWAPVGVCPLGGRRFRIPASLLASRPSATRVHFPSQLAVESVTFRPAGAE